MRPSLELNGTPHNARIASESALPRPVAEQNHVCVPRSVLLRLKRPTQHRSDTERVKKSLCDECADDRFRLGSAEIVETHWLGSGEMTKEGCAIAPVHERAWRHAFTLVRLLLAGLPNGGDPSRIAVG
jgi:hypothetical protein